LGFPIPRRTLEFSEFGWGSEVAKPLVNTTGLCKHYCVGASVVHAISAISVTIDQGEFVAISGRSGSGKSTLMNLFGLLERPDAGQYFLNGIDVAKLSGRSRTSIRNRQIGFVFQLPTFLPRSTALENVELPLAYSGIRGSVRPRKAKDALDRVGLSHRQHHCPISSLAGSNSVLPSLARL
jgi:putative ABC transport system ATP-binding protein